MWENRSQQSYWPFILISVLISSTADKYKLLWLFSLSAFCMPIASPCIIYGCCSSPTILVNWNQSKSIKVDIHKKSHDRFYRHLILIHWLISNSIDNDWFLSSIEIINMLRPAYLNHIKPSKWKVCKKFLTSLGISTTIMRKVITQSLEATHWRHCKNFGTKILFQVSHEKWWLA